MGMRLEYLNRAITGKFDPVMLSVKKDWDERTGENSFGRLECLRWALTHWSISWSSGHVFLFPYGCYVFKISRELIHINTPLFSIYHFQRTNEAKLDDEIIKKLGETNS